jgi:nucleotidyltransferase/DNA polymerase involved in DNA repair
MQQFDTLSPSQSALQDITSTAYKNQELANSANHLPTRMQEDTRAPEQARLRHGILYVCIDHFYCTLEEMFDPSLRGHNFVVGTGTGRPNEPGRVIEASPAAMQLGITPGMSLRRAHRLAPRTRFLPASYDRYQPILQKLKDCYRLYSRIIESIPISDAFIDLQGCELPFQSPVALAKQLHMEISEMGLTALIGIANGKAIAELAALMSMKDGCNGIRYIPPGDETAFVQALPLSVLLKLRAAGTGQPGALSGLGQRHLGPNSQYRSPSQDTKGKNGQIDPIAMAELIAHLNDFGITTFAQVASLKEEGLVRRLGYLGSWLHQIAHGKDHSLVIPDAPPLSQNARMCFHHQADADETCAALRKLADHLSERLREQRLKGLSIALILWPSSIRHETQQLVGDKEGKDLAVTTADKTIGGQMVLSRHTNEADVIAHHSLMLFAHYHRPGVRYQQVQLRIGDIMTSMQAYSPPPTRTRRLTRKLSIEHKK